MVHLIFDDDSPLTEPLAVETTHESAAEMLRSVLITRIREVARPNYEDAVGTFVLEVRYDSLLIGARVTIIS